MKWEGHVACTEYEMHTNFWAENWNVERHLGDLVIGLMEYNIKINLKYIGREGVDWIHMVYYEPHWRPLVNTVMNLRVP